jgi:predicted AlkP superfamily pyrophosphatase or phosphodiesterase
MVRCAAVRRIPLAALLLVLSFAPGLATAAGLPPPAVILISLDGTTPETGLRGLPSLAGIARRGAWAQRLVPVFPTNTFPNHVSLVTGVHPDRHGIVNNAFLDPERGAFDMDDDPTWIEVEPLWSLVEGHGLRTASYHWVGSEGPWRSGRGPSHWMRFDSGVKERDKVAQILAWLDLEPAAARPRLITAWFHGADHVAHREGPDAPEVARALRAQEPALAALVAGIGSRDAFEATTLIVVSDHGMERVRERVDLRAELRRAGLRARVFGGGGFASVVVRGGAPAEEKVVRVARERGLDAWRRAEAPAELRLGNARVGGVVVLAPTGVAIGAGSLRGAHGYRPGEPRMAALFAAVGRGVPAGLALGEVRSIDVAPTVLRLLGVPAPEWMEGHPVPGIGAPAEQPAEAPE